MKKLLHCSERWRLARIQNFFQRKIKATDWTLERIKDAFQQVAQDEARKMCIVQQIMLSASLRHSEDKEESQCLTYARIPSISP